MCTSHTISLYIQDTRSHAYINTATSTSYLHQYSHIYFLPTPIQPHLLPTYTSTATPTSYLHQYSHTYFLPTPVQPHLLPTYTSTATPTSYLHQYSHTYFLPTSVQPHLLPTYTSTATPTSYTLYLLTAHNRHSLHDEYIYLCHLWQHSCCCKLLF